jgi:hypothetical protein
MDTLHAAARNGDVAALTHAVASGADVNSKDKLKRTPLHMAAWAGQAASVQLLLSSGAVVASEATDGVTGATLPAVPLRARTPLKRAPSRGAQRCISRARRGTWTPCERFSPAAQKRTAQPPRASRRCTMRRSTVRARHAPRRACTIRCCA